MLKIYGITSGTVMEDWALRHIWCRERMLTIVMVWLNCFFQFSIGSYFVMFCTFKMYLIKYTAYLHLAMGRMQLSEGLIVYTKSTMLLNIRVTECMTKQCCLLYFFQCLKYRTEQQQDLKRLEKLNNILLRHMACK